MWIERVCLFSASVLLNIWIKQQHLAGCVAPSGSKKLVDIEWMYIVSFLVAAISKKWKLSNQPINDDCAGEGKTSQCDPDQFRGRRSTRGISSIEQSTCLQPFCKITGGISGICTCLLLQSSKNIQNSSVPLLKTCKIHQFHLLSLHFTDVPPFFADLFTPGPGWAWTSTP